MPKDDGDAADSEQYTPPYTPPGEATPPYTPPGGQSEPRGDEVPPPYVPPAGKEPEETVPVADADPSSLHGVYSYATFDRDDTEEKAPGSPRGFLGEVFTLDRIGATPSFKSVKGAGGQDDSTTSTAAAASALPDASAARDIDALMANLEFSTAGPPSQNKSGPGGKTAPGKKTAKQSSLAQQV